MIITIDKVAGFCPGVRRAIKKAEDELGKSDEFYSYGSILHNDSEMHRLEDQGLSIASEDDLEKLGGKKLLIRAHGEPPETYKYLEKIGVEVVDATCAVVRRIQQQVGRAADDMKKVDGQLLIFGRKMHPEVIGLAGNAKGMALILESKDELDIVDLSRPIRLFSQTTMDADQYLFISDTIQKGVREQQEEPDFIRYDTICRHVTDRIPSLEGFAERSDVIIFVSGKESSNGKKLFNVCKEKNPKTFFISEPDELKREWLDGVSTVGISGAASTPQWLMENVARKIEEII